MDRAYHLHTETSPRIYWRPYILTNEQKAIIDEQINQAQAEIDAGTQGTTLNRRDSPDVYEKQEDQKDIVKDLPDRRSESPVSEKGNGVQED